MSILESTGGYSEKLAAAVTRSIENITERSFGRLVWSAQSVGGGNVSVKVPGHGLKPGQSVYLFDAVRTVLSAGFTGNEFRVAAASIPSDLGMMLRVVTEKVQESFSGSYWVRHTPIRSILSGELDGVELADGALTFLEGRDGLGWTGEVMLVEPLPALMQRKGLSAVRVPRQLELTYVQGCWSLPHDLVSVAEHIAESLLNDGMAIGPKVSESIEDWSYTLADLKTISSVPGTVISVINSYRWI